MSRPRRATTALSETERAHALARYQQLRPALEDGAPLAQLALEHHIPLRTAQRWVAQYHTYSNPIGFAKWVKIFSRGLRPQTPASADAHLQMI